MGNQRRDTRSRWMPPRWGALFVLAGFVAGGPAPLRAVAPGEINYQGKLTDVNGNPRSGLARVQFRFYSNTDPNNPSPAALLPPPTAEYQVNVANGVFSVIFQVAPSVLQGGTERFLQVIVDGTPLLPLQKLVSAPYALSVAAGSITNAEVASGAGINVSKLSLGGTFPNGPFDFVNQVSFPGSSLFTTTGRLGIGTTNPQSTLDITANVGNPWGGWLEAIRFSRPEHSMIYHPASGLFIGLHGNRNFYFGNAIDQLYPMMLTYSGDMTVARHLAVGGNVSVAGTLGSTGAGRFDGGILMNIPGVGVDSVVDGGGGWHRTYGPTGWYNGTFGGGWNMEDVTYIRSYGSKLVLAPAYVDQNDANYVLDPNGNSILNTVRLTGGAPAAGRVLTSDAIGNGSWQALPAVPPAVPRGTVIFVFQNVQDDFGGVGGCPTGWRRMDEAIGRVMVGGIGYGQVGAAGLAPLGTRTISEVPRHTHTGTTGTGTPPAPDGPHVHDYTLYNDNAAVEEGNSGIGASVQGDEKKQTDWSGPANAGIHTHNLAINETGVSNVDVTMPYVQLLPCYKE